MSATTDRLAALEDARQHIMSGKEIPDETIARMQAGPADDDPLAALRAPTFVGPHSGAQLFRDFYERTSGRNYR